jgi:phosphoserine phosphatase
MRDPVKPTMTHMHLGDPLPSWNATRARDDILAFVDAAMALPPEERVAVFDNDGTLWCEKPMPIELAFIMQRLAEMAEEEPSLRQRQPWQAACTRDFGWLGDAMIRHYHGDDSGVQELLGAMLQAFAGATVEAYCAAADRFLRNGRHPTLARGLLACGYLPMIELIRHLEANGFTVYIASGGDRDFMRPITQEVYGVPPERVIGSSSALRYVEGDDGGSVIYLAEPDVFDDGPVKPVRIWSRIGRRPILAGGNSNGDIPMLRFAGGRDRPALRLLLDHDDAVREFAYRAGAEESLRVAAADGWTVVSVKRDWSTVFAH